MTFESISSTPLSFFDKYNDKEIRKKITDAEQSLLDRFDRKQEGEFYYFMNKMIKERMN